MSINSQLLAIKFKYLIKIDGILTLTAMPFHSSNATQNISEQEEYISSSSFDDILT